MPKRVLLRPPTSGSFQKGHRKSVGGRGRDAEARRKEYDRKFLTRGLLHELERKSRDGNGISVTNAQRVIRQLVRLAGRGDAKAIKEIFDRVEGRPIQGVELTGRDKKPIEVIRRDMTPQEAARIFQSMLKDED